EAGHALGIHRRHGVAVHIGRHLIGEGLHLVAPHAGRRRLEAGRSGGVEESFQEVHGVSGHGWRTGMGERRTRRRRRTLSAATPGANSCMCLGGASAYSVPPCMLTTTRSARPLALTSRIAG